MSVFKEPIDWIQKSIDSILSQTYSDFEFIIINDNPLDLKVSAFLKVKCNQDSRIIVHQNSENIGLTKSLNIGLRQCKGKYIARMDADDISLPKRFEKQVTFLENNPDVIVCGTNIKYFGMHSPLKYKNIFRKDLDIRGQMLLDSGFVHPSVMIRKQVISEYNIMYDESYRTAQDYRLWYDLSAYGEFANLEEVLLLYRLSHNQISKTSTSNQINGRSSISSLFREKGINGCKMLYDEDKKKLDIISKPEKENHKEYRIVKAYYQRAYHYYTFSLTNLLPVIFSRYTRISLKERLLILLLTIRKLFK